MLLYRIAHRSFADLSGAGGTHVGGRWHSRGRPIVYLAGSTSLAALEVLGHTDSDLLPPLQLLTIEAPDHLSSRQILPDQLPRHWRDVPAPTACQELGDRWLIDGQSCLLLVPSVHVPIEQNVLLNPLHAQAREIRIIHRQPFEFDRRLL